MKVQWKPKGTRSGILIVASGAESNVEADLIKIMNTDNYNTSKEFQGTISGESS
jgi:hypothetical protein